MPAQKATKCRECARGTTIAQVQDQELNALNILGVYGPPYEIHVMVENWRTKNLQDALQEWKERAEKAEAAIVQSLSSEGRCPIGHNAKFVSEYRNEVICVACERDVAEAKLALAVEALTEIANGETGWLEIADDALAKIKGE